MLPAADLYAARTESRAREIRDLSGRFDAVSWGRLVTFVGGVTLLAVAAWIRLPRLWWGLGAALLVAFAALVVVHGRLARARERAAGVASSSRNDSAAVNHNG
jgi:hypothetical protein